MSQTSLMAFLDHSHGTEIHSGMLQTMQIGTELTGLVGPDWALRTIPSDQMDWRKLLLLFSSDVERIGAPGHEFLVLYYVHYDTKCDDPVCKKGDFAASGCKGPT